MHYKSAIINFFSSQVIELLENSLRLLKNVCLLIKVVRFPQSEKHPREIVSEKRVRWKQVAEKNQESSSTSERRVAHAAMKRKRKMWSKGTLLRLPMHMLNTDITKEKKEKQRFFCGLASTVIAKYIFFQSFFLSPILSFI